MEYNELLPFYSPLLKAIDSLLERKPNPIIAIDGCCASGKSSLANGLAVAYDCCVIKMDDFFLPPVKRTEDRLSQPGGNIDYERFKDEVISKLSQEEEFSYGVFSCKAMALTGQAKVNPKKMLVVEGSYSLHPYFGQPYDLRVFLSTQSETQLDRIVKRNGESMAKNFQRLWIPMENKYFKEMCIQEGCHFNFLT